jgi:hypothetical protein
MPEEMIEEGRNLSLFKLLFHKTKGVRMNDKMLILISMQESLKSI